MKGERGEDRRQRTEEGRGLKGFWNVKVICAVISGVALIVAACIGVADRYLLEGVDDGQVPVPLLEEQLSDVNIYLSKTDVNRVRGYLRNDPAYQALANDCLVLLKGKQLISPVPLDVINGRYKNELGLKGNAYIAADRYDASGKLGRAIYEAWEEKQPGGAAGKRGGLRGILVGR